MSWFRFTGNSFSRVFLALVIQFWVTMNGVMFFLPRTESGFGRDHHPERGYRAKSPTEHYRTGLLVHLVLALLIPVSCGR